MPRDVGMHLRQQSLRLEPAILARRTDEAFLQVLSELGASSRANIARATGLSKPTASESAQRLLAAGVIVSCGQGLAERGRPTQLYDINPDYGHVVGVAIERGHAAVRALDFRGSMIADVHADSAEFDDVPAALARARDLIVKVSSDSGSPRLATALAVAAPVAPGTGTVVDWPNSPFTGAVNRLGNALGIPPDEPLVVDNDVHWATLAEYRIGSMQHTDDFLYVYLGSGIGAGLLLSGRVHRGSRGLAGEIAFIRSEDGDTLISKLARSPIGTHDGWGGSIDIKRAVALFDDPQPDTDLRPVVRELALAISNVAAALDPRRIVIGGPLSQSRRLVDALRQSIEPIALDGLTVSATSLGRDAPLCGASINALELARDRATSPDPSRGGPATHRNW